MNSLTSEAKAAATLAGYTCIAQHAVELSNQYRRLILPGKAIAHSYMGEKDPTKTLTAFVFEDGSELSSNISFTGSRIDAYWSNESCVATS